MEININTKEIRKFNKTLGALNSEIIPKATNQMLNDVAFKAQSVARVDLSKKMILRNKFSVSSIRVDKSRSVNNMANQKSKVGSIADYLAKQEGGYIEKKKGRHGVSVPTGAASGESNARLSTRLPRPSNRMRRIKFNSRYGNSLPLNQRNVARIKNAKKSNNKLDKFVYLDFGKQKGIFKVMGGARAKRARLKMIHNFNKPSVVIPKNPWLEPSSERAMDGASVLYINAMRRLLK